MKRTISVFLLLIISLQSCVTIYQKTPSSWDKVVNTGKVKTNSFDDKEVVFNNIELEDGIYYGERFKGKERIDTSQISKIYLKDIRKSKRQSTLNLLSIPLGLGIYFLIVGLLASNVSL